MLNTITSHAIMEILRYAASSQIPPTHAFTRFPAKSISLLHEILGTKKSKLIVGIGHSDDNRNRQEHHLNPDYIYPSFDKNIEIKII